MKIRRKAANREIMAEIILHRVAAGDRSAVGDCLDNYGDLIWNWTKRIVPGVNEAEDAVQEIFLEIWKTAEEFDSSKSSEINFVAMIARKCLIARLRKTTRQKGTSLHLREYRRSLQKMKIKR